MDSGKNPVLGKIGSQFIPSCGSYDEEMIDMIGLGRVPHWPAKLNRDRRQFLFINRRKLTTRLVPVREPPESDPEECRLQFIQPRIQSAYMTNMTLQAPSIPKLSCGRYIFFPNEAKTTSIPKCSQVLCRIEAPRDVRREVGQRPAIVSCTVRLARILYEGDFGILRQFTKANKVACLAVQMDWEQRDCLCRDSTRCFHRVKQECIFVHVGEHGTRASSKNGNARERSRQGACDYLPLGFTGGAEPEKAIVIASVPEAVPTQAGAPQKAANSLSNAATFRT